MGEEMIIKESNDKARNPKHNDLFLENLTRSTAPSPAFEGGVEKRRSGSTLSKPQPSGWGVVEGLNLEFWNGLGFRILKLGFYRAIVPLVVISLLLGFGIARVGEVRAGTKSALAILPFLIERGEDPGRGAICPICKRVYGRGEILLGSQNRLTRLLHQKMDAMRTFQLLSMEKMEEALSQWERRDFEEKLIPSSIQLGKELNVDFIIIGFLFRYEERIGSPIGAEKPASVAFDIHLFRVRDGIEVWRGRFDETQRPLSENLLKIGSFFRRKASWLAAEELASVGMDEMLKRLPTTQELEGK